MQPDFELRLFPVNLDHLGKNPYGKPVYRVVWADTRRDVVYCQGRRHVMPRYANGAYSELKGTWIVEKWVDPKTLLGMGREQWEALVASIPNAAVEKYPEKGDYELHLALGTKVDATLVAAMIERHEHRFRTTTAEERRIDIERAEDEKQERQAAALDEAYDEAREEVIQ